MNENIKFNRLKNRKYLLYRMSSKHKFDSFLNKLILKEKEYIERNTNPKLLKYKLKEFENKQKMLMFFIKNKVPLVEFYFNEFYLKNKNGIIYINENIFAPKKNTKFEEFVNKEKRNLFVYDIETIYNQNKKNLELNSIFGIATVVLYNNEGNKTDYLVVNDELIKKYGKEIFEGVIEEENLGLKLISFKEFYERIFLDEKYKNVGYNNAGFDNVVILNNGTGFRINTFDTQGTDFKKKKEIETFKEKLSKLDTFDVMVRFKDKYGFNFKLDELSSVLFGQGKTDSDAVSSAKFLKDMLDMEVSDNFYEELKNTIKYCYNDTKITEQLYDYCLLKDKEGDSFFEKYGFDLKILKQG